MRSSLRIGLSRMAALSAMVLVSAPSRVAKAETPKSNVSKEETTNHINTHVIPPIPRLKCPEVPTVYVGMYNGIMYSTATIRGKRSYQEDRCSAVTPLKANGDVLFFGMFDGHAGDRCSQFANDNLPSIVDDELSKARTLVGSKFVHEKMKAEDPKSFLKTTGTNEGKYLSAIISACGDALSASFKEADRRFLADANKHMWNDGACILVALVAEDNFVVGNAGDCRAVMCRGEETVPLSHDHKPNRLDEFQRVKAAGGFVAWKGVWRVQGILAISRSFGDRSLKQWVVPDAEVVTEPFPVNNSFVIVATDGFWDVFSNEDAINYARKFIDTPDLGAEELVLEAYGRGSGDNITVMVIKRSNTAAAA
eukprot:CFRG2999T1